MRNSTIRVATFAGPAAEPVIRSVPWPQVPKNAALIQIGACGVCGTDLHILKGHWPKPLPWPFTLGHELGGVIVEKGGEFTEDFMGKTLGVGSKVMIPALMPCGQCYYCVHYPHQANKCLTPVYYGRYLGFDKPPHLWGGFAEYVYVDLDMLPGTKVYKLPDDMPLRLGALSEPLTSCIRAFNRAVRAGGFTWGDTVVIQGSGPIGILATSWHRICAKDLNVLGSWAFTANDLPLGVDMLDRARDKYPWLDMQTLYPFDEGGVSRAVKDAMAMKTVKSTIVPWPELV